MEEKDKIMKLKSEPAVCTYLQFLQGNISRMGGNSDSIKALIAVVYTIFITVLVAISELKNYWWIGLIVAFTGMIMDAYYLALERVYVKKYNNFVKNLNELIINEKEIYDMKPQNTNLKFEIFALILESIRSFSVWGFYVLFIIITILLRLI